MLQQTLKAAEAVANKMAQPTGAAVAAPLRKRPPHDVEPPKVNGPHEAEPPKVDGTHAKSCKRLKPCPEVENTQQHSTGSKSPDEVEASCSPPMAMETKDNGDPPKVDDKQEPRPMNDKENSPETGDTNDQEQPSSNTPEDSQKPVTAQIQPATDAENMQEPGNEKPKPAVWKGARKVLTRQAGPIPKFLFYCCFSLYEHTYISLRFQQRTSNPP